MNRIRTLVLILIVMLGAQTIFAGSSSIKPQIPIGKWKVAFANGVTQTCEVGKDGFVGVREPRRSAKGSLDSQDQAFIIAYVDDRTERWTPVGDRYVVEHWFPASKIPVVHPVLGIAERTR